MMHSAKPPHIVELERIDDHLRDGRPREAELLARQFAERHPQNIDGWILLGRAQIDLVQYAAAMESANAAIALDAKHPVARSLMMNALLRNGQPDAAFEQARQLETERKFDPALMLTIGSFYTQTNRHADAARCYERVRILQPANHAVIFNLTSAHIALGNLDKAEALFDELLRKDPQNFNAYYPRSTVRKQTAQSNHVAEMEAILRQVSSSGEAEPILCYSLAKELEDLGESERAFHYLKRGAKSRRHAMAYRVERDIAMLEGLEAEFGSDFFAQPHAGYDAASPIFVLGLPRSGTTLVDRILSSHSAVGSVGESGEFSAAVARQGGGSADDELIGIEDVRALDYAAIGRDYCRSVEGLLPGHRTLLDKTPANFHFVGMILTALPNARIVHLRRHPVDSCYAIYKTLFRKGYSYSYDLRDLGRYYLAYARLMAHWRQVLPDRFLDVSYEDLVANQEAESRRMVAFCGLEWEDACLSFEKNASPSLTASAAQVRQPIYKTSVALWRRYERELEPLVRILREGGIAVD